MRRALHSDQSGFTMVELLMAMTIGLVILGSATMITIGAARHNNEVAYRTDATAQGRLAMDRMVRQLRSQVCTSASLFPVTDARADRVTFTSDMSNGTRPVERHTYALDVPNRRITDSVALGNTAVPVAFGTPSNVLIASDAVRSGTNPVFRYYTYPSPPPSSGVMEPSVQLVPPTNGTLSTADLGRIARIDINFTTTGMTEATRNIRAQMSDRVFVRLADPNAVSTNPSCA